MHFKDFEREAKKMNKNYFALNYTFKKIVIEKYVVNLIIVKYIIKESDKIRFKKVFLGFLFLIIAFHFNVI